MASNPSRLPDEVLRQILECAAQSDSKTASPLALVSRKINQWIDDIIYSEVHLLNQRTAYLFLRTIQQPLNATESTLRVKSREYFALFVKSIYLYSELDAQSVASILSACSGVKELTYWPASSNFSSKPHTHDPRSPFSTKTCTVIPQTIDSSQSSDMRNLVHLTPRKLSLLLQESHPIFLFQSIKPISFFSTITHLSIVNRWEEWTSWTEDTFAEHVLPRLQYLKFDFAVGPAPPEDYEDDSFDTTENNGVTSAWIKAVTGTYVNPGKHYSTIFSDVGWSEFTSKTERVAGALSRVLNNHALLRVCVIVLRFDSDGARTARIISRLASSEFKTCTAPGSLGFDARLVFAWEKEPFRYSYAHSMHDDMIWKCAEAASTWAFKFISSTLMTSGLFKRKWPN
ncbi:hypothetical protein CPB84DRAFT_1750157 [Gymnopilus junonius]|uniref:F-box domain-containing protein n=1 Tax=Gymnopilus junonius TaxID=109634 RepID=A0A9P5TK15_GYMJU|nr:hypothetical protein CPB84DRAFT_1750157 [Gymnopilus junonius]